MPKLKKPLKNIPVLQVAELYFGDSATNGTWRIIPDGNDLNFERRESGTYVKKGADTP